MIFDFIKHKINFKIKNNELIYTHRQQKSL